MTKKLSSDILEIIKNLPSEIKPPSFQDNAEKLKKLKKKVDEAARQQLKKEIAADPTLANSFGIRIETTAYKKQPPDFWQVYDSLLIHLLYRHNALLKQKDLLAVVKKNYPHLKILPNVWNKKLNAKQKRRMQGHVSDAKPGINISRLKTIAEIKRVVKAQLLKASAEQKFKPEITISKTAVTVGKTAHPITTRKAGSAAYPCIRIAVGTKRQWLRVDALFALLKP